ncbi:TetR family transcriptional regulator [Terrabacter tumescens]|uniref:TetR family transcriptional regulator n=1 Tax=Terrabacter tumescens TaxID=60443 RepID=A0ABQ2HNM4_9MICO|nr:TetR/AcrR family transcriptional regulator [Terrabacter tumescens]GGM85621.1 TetR family transcriptional regulator [Terrabacter tumescens]
MSSGVKGSARSYDGSGRLRSSAQRQLRVVEVAGRLLVERGYAATTVADIAEAAQVSVPWLYKAFGPKPKLVKRVYDVLMAGDLDPVPIAERPPFQALAAETDPYAAVQRYADISRDLVSRMGPLAAVLLAAGHSGHGDITAIADTLGRERLWGATAFTDRLAALGALAPGLNVEGARDVVWTLISPEVYRMLVLERGWTDTSYERWLARSLTSALLKAR